MSRRGSKEDRAAHLMHLEKQVTLLGMFMHDTITQRKPDGTASDDSFSLILFRCQSAHGGYVVLYQTGPQTASCHYLDDLTEKPWESEIRLLAGKLSVVRNKLLAEAS
jgi:hypothetical protein